MDDDKTPPEDLEPTKATDDMPPAPTVRLPASIGCYRILSKIGEGGMGVVYEAEQEHPRRKVAVKVIRGGQFVDEHRVKLFEREADTLARLKHANIGAIHESGRTDDGQHFFAMELVRGETLDRYMEKRPKVVTRQELRFRLALLRKIADAVHYAHQRGVIHRDLKPTNIIVTDTGDSGVHPPEIKILDFGLARITEIDVAAATLTTEVGVIKGTLPYMSPEQALGNPEEIDVRTDVYALGVMLYELLTGRRPYDVLKKPLVEAVRVICEEPPRSLKTTWSGVRKLDSDIETIVGKALEKEADRRYGSAAALSEDIGRYLSSQPILSRPASVKYQLSKFARRNKVLVGGVAAVFVALAAGAFVSTWQAVRAKRAEADARIEAATAEQVAEFLVGLFQVSDPSEARGSTITAREILDKGAGEIAETLADQPEVQARLMATIGDVYRKLGLSIQAQPLLQQALTKQREVLGDEHSDTLETMNKLAWLLMSQGRHDEAEPLYRENLEIYRRVSGADDPKTLNAMNTLASLYRSQGRRDEAEPLYRESFETYRRVLGHEHPSTLASMSNLAAVYQDEGRYDEAEPLFLESLEIYRRLLGHEHPRTIAAMSNVASLYTVQARYGEARQLLERVIATSEEVLGTEFEDYPVFVHSRGELSLAIGDFEEAERDLRRAIELYEVRGGHAYLGLARYQLAGLLARRADHEAALVLLRRAVDNGYLDGSILESPDFASLHGDPGFEAIVAEVKNQIGGE